MVNVPDTQLQSIDTAMLTPLVRQALGSGTVEVVDWDTEQIYAGGTRARIYRYSGEAREGGKTVPWSLILKVERPQADLDDPSHPQYWKREALAYQSGLLDDLLGELTAPRCLAVVEQPEGDVWLWLEEVADDIGSNWPLEHYGLVARHLGQFNGAYLAGRPIPSQSWLSRGWLRSWLSPVAEVIDQLPSALEQPLGRRWLPGNDCEALMHLWNTREVFLKVLDRLPQTLCHRDAFRRNLFARGGEDGGYETVTIDWADLGPGPVGEEIVPLVLGTLRFLDLELAQARPLDHIVFEGYLDGLRDAGWRGDPREVRLGFTAGAIRYVLGPISDFLTLLRDEEQYAFWERALGRPMEEIFDESGQYRHFALGLLAEARELMDRL